MLETSRSLCLLSKEARRGRAAPRRRRSRGGAKRSRGKINMTITWIGTGIMGAPMVRRLLKAGHKVSVFNRSPEKAQRLAADGATVVSDPASAAAEAEVIFIMVPDTPDVEATIARIKPALRKGQLV
ncbi:MAG TPA: NAD(P)-binding domain-containing protein, partial [Candidatus Binataceae bacterium]|nr:NAD(P)-binding domain-containing protein [Candidatus Binataceae bacterium]